MPILSNKQIVILLHKTFYLLDSLYFNDDGELVSGWAKNGSYSICTKDRKIDWFIEVPDHFKPFSTYYIVDWAKSRARAEILNYTTVMN